MTHNHGKHDHAQDEGPKQPLGDVAQEKDRDTDDLQEDPEHSGARPDLKREGREDEDDGAGGVGLGY